jgi:hypothetical protein
MHDDHRDVMSARYEMQTIHLGWVQELENRVLWGTPRQVPDRYKVSASTDTGPEPTPGPREISGSGGGDSASLPQSSGNLSTLRLSPGVCGNVVG